jgi:hypothetical protein
MKTTNNVSGFQQDLREHLRFQNMNSNCNPPSERKLQTSRFSFSRSWNTPRTKNQYQFPTSYGFQGQWPLTSSFLLDVKERDSSSFETRSTGFSVASRNIWKAAQSSELQTQATLKIANPPRTCSSHQYTAYRIARLNFRFEILENVGAFHKSSVIE